MHIHSAINYNTPDMLATLRQAILELKPYEASAYLVFPVDFPFVHSTTVRSLIEAHKQNPLAVLRPCYKDKCGHPILIPSSLDVYNDDAGLGLRYLIHASQITTLDIPVLDEGILRNINKPEDLF